MLDEETLAAELLNVSGNPTSVESEAIQSLMDAYSTYASDATANGVPINNAAVIAAASAASSTLVGMSATNQGLTKIPQAIASSFWGTLAASPGAAFSGATAITPPPHATLSAQFPIVMSNNTSGEVSAIDAAANTANLLHQQATTGGTVTFPGPVVFPII